MSVDLFKQFSHTMILLNECSIEKCNHCVSIQFVTINKNVYQGNVPTKKNVCNPNNRLEFSKAYLELNSRYFRFRTIFQEKKFSSYLISMPRKVISR